MIWKLKGQRETGIAEKVKVCVAVCWTKPLFSHHFVIAREVWLVRGYLFLALLLSHNHPPVQNVAKPAP